MLSGTSPIVGCHVLNASRGCPPLQPSGDPPAKTKHRRHFGATSSGLSQAIGEARSISIKSQALVARAGARTTRRSCSARLL